MSIETRVLGPHCSAHGLTLLVCGRCKDEELAAERDAHAETLSLLEQSRDSVNEDAASAEAHEMHGAVTRLRALTRRIDARLDAMCEKIGGRDDG